MAKLTGVERWRSCQQLVQNQTEAVDVAACVDPGVGEPCLLGAHVLGGSDQHAQGGVRRRTTVLDAHRLRHAEIDDLGYWLCALFADQNVARLQVPVQDRFLMRVFDAVADLAEYVKTVVKIERVLVGERGNWSARYVLHHEVRPFVRHHSRIEYRRDVWMVQNGQRLPLGLESRQHLTRGTTWLDHLQCDGAAEWMVLFRQPDRTHPALADQLDQSIRAMPTSRLVHLTSLDPCTSITDRDPGVGPVD